MDAAAIRRFMVVAFANPTARSGRRSRSPDERSNTVVVRKMGGAKRYPSSPARPRWVSLRSTHPTSLRTDLLGAQVQSRRPTATKSLVGQITQNLSSPLPQKYSAFVLTQIIGITPLVSRRMRGVGHRHERAVRCDGRASCD